MNDTLKMLKIVKKKRYFFIEINIKLSAVPMFSVHLFDTIKIFDPVAFDPVVFLLFYSHLFKFCQYFRCGYSLQLLFLLLLLLLSCYKRISVNHNGGDN